MSAEGVILIIIIENIKVGSLCYPLRSLGKTMKISAPIISSDMPKLMKRSSHCGWIGGRFDPKRNLKNSCKIGCTLKCKQICSSLGRLCIGSSDFWILARNNAGPVSEQRPNGLAVIVILSFRQKDRRTDRHRSTL